MEYVTSYGHPILRLKTDLLNPTFVRSFEMALGEKLFEERGDVTGFNITKVHPIEGVTMEVSFTSEIRGIGRTTNMVQPRVCEPEHRW